MPFRMKCKQYCFLHSISIIILDKPTSWCIQGSLLNAFLMMNILILLSLQREHDEPLMITRRICQGLQGAPLLLCLKICMLTMNKLYYSLTMNLISDSSDYIWFCFLVSYYEMKRLSLHAFTKFGKVLWVLTRMCCYSLERSCPCLISAGDCCDSITIVDM